LKAWTFDVGDYTTTTEGLKARRVNPGRANWNGPYLPRDVPRDPWGRAYYYAFPAIYGDAPEILSLGADGAPGGEGINTDIISWQLGR
jgi:general secretion pathway protein G